MASRAIRFVMKVLLAVAVLSFAVAFTSSAFAQLPDVSQPGYTSQTTGLGTTSKNASGGAAPSATPNEEANTDESDNTLYHGKTTDMDNVLLRDDGMLHFKSRPKEKTQNVDSLKSLQSSGTDRKFQGELAISGVSSIDKVAAKSTQQREVQSDNGAVQNEPQADSQLVLRHMTFPAPANEKTEKTQTKPSPSPTPSPSASPAAKHSSGSKE